MNIENLYQETLDFMFAQLPMFQQKGKEALKPKLTNIIHFCKELGMPHQQYPSVHIAGTNGKGSSSHAIASVLQHAGYKVGLYTSPHLKDFRERIKVNGQQVPKEFVCNFIDTHKDFLMRNELSFFEMSVGMAFAYFAYEEVDIAIIEVGLGGKWDSTNIITPIVSLITNIGYDHTDILGKTIVEIALQKAGIIKERVPIVISEYDEEAAVVFQEQARAFQAPIYFCHTKEVAYEMDLKGSYQKQNIKGIIGVVEILQKLGWKIPEEAIKNGLKSIVPTTGLQGRWQVLQQTPKVICDTGHNFNGLKLVLDQLLKEKYKNLHLVLGFVKEKDLHEILPLFPKEAKYYFTQPAIPRALSVDILKENASKCGLEGDSFPSVAKALQVAKENAQDNDVIFVGGSTFVVAEVL